MQGVRPDPKITKLLYKLMKTPKSLQQNDQNIPELTLMGWKKESLPTNPGIQG